MKITWETMQEARDAGYPVLIIINGEYYEMDYEPKEVEDTDELF